MKDKKKTEIKDCKAMPLNAIVNDEPKEEKWVTVTVDNLFNVTTTPCDKISDEENRGFKIGNIVTDTDGDKLLSLKISIDCEERYSDEAIKEGKYLIYRRLRETSKLMSDSRHIKKAVREVAYLCNKENPDWDFEKFKDNYMDENFDYGCSTYANALSAFEAAIIELEYAGHSGNSIEYAKAAIKRLLDEKPLTGIGDKDFEWVKSEYQPIWAKENETVYENKRYRRFKKITNTNGYVCYTDFDRCSTHDLYSNTYWSPGNKFADYIDKKYPITVPYYPKDKKYILNLYSFCTNGEVGCTDTYIWMSYKTPEGKTIPRFRLYAEAKNHKHRPIGFIELAIRGIMWKANKTKIMREFNEKHPVKLTFFDGDKEIESFYLDTEEQKDLNKCIESNKKYVGHYTHTKIFDYDSKKRKWVER